MAVHFFEDGFDYKRYIDERLLDVKDIDERSQIRNVVAEMLVPFYERIEEQYRQIEDRLFEKEVEQSGNYQIVTGIQARNRIDVTDKSMFPMRMQDLEDIEVQVEDLLSAVRQEQEYKIYSVFVQADYKVIRQLENSKRTFRALIRTQWGEYPATVKLSKNHEYLNQIRELYHEFINNGIEWKTVCAPYLHKIFDVNIVTAQCPEEERIEEISVMFEDVEPYIKYNYVPLWNIRSITVKTSSYPTFCLDKIHYEHCIYGTRLKPENDYIVEGKRHLWSVERKDGDLYIQCDEKVAIDWGIKEFCYETAMRNYDLPLLKNHMSAPIKPIRTVAEVKNYVTEMTNGKFIELQDVNQKNRNQEEETYDCDEFIIDEIRKSKKGQDLYFEFANIDKESILTRDIMSYVVSRLQMIYPEYHCKGVLL